MIPVSKNNIYLQRKTEYTHYYYFIYSMKDHLLLWVAFLSTLPLMAVSVLFTVSKG